MFSMQRVVQSHSQMLEELPLATRRAGLRVPLPKRENKRPVRPRYCTPPKHRWRVEDKLLRAPIPSDEELHRVEIITKAANEAEHATWGDAVEAKVESKKYSAFEQLRSSFLDEHGKAILKELGPGYTLQPADVSHAVQQKFVTATAEGASNLDYGFHGTRAANIPSILQRGLLVPGSKSGKLPPNHYRSCAAVLHKRCQRVKYWPPVPGIGVMNGSAHGVGIYTALPGQSWLSRSFTDSANMLVCGVLDPGAEPSPFAEIVKKEAEVAAVPQYVGEHRNHHKPAAAQLQQASVPVKQVWENDREGEGLKVRGAARIIFEEEKSCSQYDKFTAGPEFEQKLGGDAESRLLREDAQHHSHQRDTAVSMFWASFALVCKKVLVVIKIWFMQGGSGQVYIPSVDETVWAAPEEARGWNEIRVKRRFVAKDLRGDEPARITPTTTDTATTEVRRYCKAKEATAL
eukprot:4197367-Amphidinium_carterae.1